MLGNIHVLYACLQKGVEAWIVDKRNCLYLLDEGKTFCRDQLWGSYVSFLPYTEQVTGITLTGFKYPLNKKPSAGGRRPACASAMNWTKRRQSWNLRTAC